MLTNSWRKVTRDSFRGRDAKRMGRHAEVIFDRVTEWIKKNRCPENPAEAPKILESAVKKVEALMNTTFASHIKDWNNVISTKLKALLLYSHVCNQQKLVEAQGPEMVRHLRRLRIPEDHQIIVAPAQSRDFYLSRRRGHKEGRHYYSIHGNADPGASKNNPEGCIQWACAGCGSTMKSRANVESRLLVIFSLDSKDPECAGDPRCVQMGKWNCLLYTSPSPRD